MELTSSFFRTFLIFSGFLLSVVIFVNEAHACGCYPTKTVAKEFAESDKVVVLKLQSIRQNDGEAANYLMSIEKVFKGNLKPGEILTFTLDSNCSWFFSETDVGTEYLFYLGEKPNKGEKWIGSICSRSGRIKDRTDDLLYLEKEKQLRGKTRLSGKVEKLIGTAAPLTDSSVELLAGRKITITGMGKTTVLKTDENGVYEIYDLPPGTYRIKPEKIEGFKFDTDNTSFVEVQITLKGQTEQNFIYQINNAISGTVADKKGKLLNDICLNLIPVGNEAVRWLNSEVCTNKNGFFEFSLIPEGSYLLGINQPTEEPGRFSRNPYFDGFYYSNVKNKTEAIPIVVGGDYFLRNLKIVPPEMFQTVTVSGTLLFSDGQPVAGGFVEFLKDGETPKTPKSKPEIMIFGFDFKTDNKGRFFIKIIKGQKGILRGTIITYLGQYKNCPEIDNLLKEKGKSVEEINTDDLKTDANADLSGIELKFPFPKCQKMN